ncbi:MAG TPA: ABC transporter permease subunit [Acidobacteriota bacterium]|nr:ABC transporter permease subunit [Acidobacteriota bacterium]
MLKAILRREILEYLISPKFLIGISLAVVLMVTSTVINLANYRQRQQDYIDAQRDLKGDRATTTIVRGPRPLSVLVQGLDRKLGTKMEVSSWGIPASLSGYMGYYTSDHLRFLSGFEAVDFAFIVRVIFSLMVIFLAYNSVSEEKSQGTLGLVLSHSVPRDQLLLGKFLGGLFVIVGSMLISALLSFLILVLGRSIALSREDWERIAAILLFSVLYLITFYSLSLFVSVLVNRPSIALMILLQVWIFLVVIYPNLGVVIASNFYRLPSQEEVAQQKEAAFQTYEAEYHRIEKDLHDSYSSGKRPDKSLGLRNAELSAIHAECVYKVDQDFNRRLTEQVALARRAAFLSPAVLFDTGTTRLARTDLNDYERFMSGVLDLWQSHVENTKLLYKDIAAFRKAKLPPYRYASESRADSFSAVLPQALSLFFIGVIFFMLAHVSFLKKDVR